MFASGVVKLTSRCPTWWGLTGECPRETSVPVSVNGGRPPSLIPPLRPDSVDVPLRDSVHPHAAGLVCPPVAGVVAEAERDRDLCDRDPRPAALLQPGPQTPPRSLLPAGGKARGFSSGNRI